MGENMSSDDAASIASTLQVILTEVRERFDGIDKRFDGLETRMDRLEARFDALEARMDTVEQRFEVIETQLAQLRQDTAQMWREIIQRIDERSEDLRRDMRVFMTEMRADWHRSLQLWDSQLDTRTLSLQGKIDALTVRVTAVERQLQRQSSE